MNKKIRVLIADDHPLIRKGLNSLLNSEPDILLVGEAADGEEAVQMAHLLIPDVVILDLVMPKKNGLSAISEIIEDHPGTRILVLTSFSEDEMVFPAIKAGAMGYLLKDTAYQDLVQAIREVYKGESSMHPTIARKFIQEFVKPRTSTLEKPVLSEREIEVLKFVACGFSNREVAHKLFISDRTVAVHVQNILRKLHAANRTEAARIALQEGIVDLRSIDTDK